MADCIEEGRFWLPSEFFDDFDGNSEKNGAELDSEFRFPNEFPFDLEIEGRSHHLKKQWVTSTSPQSTLVSGSIWLGGSRNGSPNDVVSPPTTPLGGRRIDAVGDLIQQAAGQVAKLKLSGGVGPGPTKHNNFLGPPRIPEHIYSSPSVLHSHNLRKNTAKQQMWFGEPGRAGQVAWPVYPNPARFPGTGTGGGASAAARNRRAGTGVFLPRGYGSNNNNDKNGYSSDSRRKTGQSSSGYVQDRSLYSVNKNSRDYDMLMGRRNGAMVQQGVGLGMSHGDHYIPQGWMTY